MGVRGSENGDDGCRGDSGKMERARVVRDRDGSGVQQGERLRERALSDEINDLTRSGPGSERGEVWRSPAILGTAGENDLAALRQKLSGQGNVAFDWPAAQGVVAEQVASTCRHQHDTSAAGGGQ